MQHDSSILPPEIDADRNNNTTMSAILRDPHTFQIINQCRNSSYETTVEQISAFIAD